jgi:hypothetical protein
MTSNTLQAPARLGDDHAAIAALLERYTDALRDGNVDALRATFHPDARYVTAAGGELTSLDLEAYLARVGGRTPPSRDGRPFAAAVEAVDVVGPETALARMRSTMLGKRFVDLLSLIKTGGAWRIAAKIFHHETDA